MCGGSPSVDTSYQDFQKEEAERARREEEERQARVDTGLEQIAAIFEGGTYTPTDGGDPITYEGMDPFLAQREQAQNDFYIPQLDKARGNATDELTFALARAGLLNSTVAGDRQAELAEDYALQKGSVLADIASDIAGTQTRMNQSRSAAEAALRASGDNTAAANQALQSAVTFRSEQPQLNPLGNVFFGISEGIGSARDAAEAERIRKLATPNPMKTGASRVVGA